jgi:ribosomal protein S18 acetylase RimI-like enzyme
VTTTAETSEVTWSWRRAEAADDPFLDQLYESTRLEEVSRWGLAPVQALAFLRDQARLQRASYALQVPGAEHRVLLADDQPIGRLILARGADRWSIVDVSVLPAWRRRGAGTRALREVLSAAAAVDRPVRLHVDRENHPARLLYAKLGFYLLPPTAEPSAEDVAPLVMEWLPLNP